MWPLFSSEARLVPTVYPPEAPREEPRTGGLPLPYARGHEGEFKSPSPWHATERRRVRRAGVARRVRGEGQGPACAFYSIDTSGGGGGGRGAGEGRLATRRVGVCMTLGVEGHFHAVVVARSLLIL